MTTKSPVDSAREFLKNPDDPPRVLILHKLMELIEYAESLEHEIETLSEHCELLEIDLEELKDE